ncbi:MarR family winged helix-turn-helix transcriptional regulator [Catellatospora citrea]|uniref:Transcriptional regulator n=1 Tax=Catellatospora citrea TaxID=53366 RepID=A0A8J3KJP9_9ACTN|nr:MarR family transcriptional regulator [Catellatospora citrea]RKE08266.1 DNA-binding MarR family transcriptional regulator [Catellatospora citrea]GIG01303.1 transcriptional regulator [Catellatospora citrea]
MATTATQTTAVPWLTEPEQAAWRSFITTAKLVMAELERGMTQHDLSGTDYGVLVSLSEAPDRRLRMSELAQAMLLEKSRLSHQITRMERAGLVRRQSCPSDRRGQFAVLTDEGWETIQRVAPHHVELVRAIFIDRLTPAQLAQLTEIFTPLHTSMREQCPRDEADC